MLVFRLHSSRCPADSGKGAAITGGRWNRKGIEAVYAAQSRALAALEVLVHYSVLPKDFVMTTIQIPDGLVHNVEDSFRSQRFTWIPELFPPVFETQELAFRIRPAVLGVPSAVMLGDRNYVINPAHRDFHLIEFRDPVPFRFDPRLMR